MPSPRLKRSRQKLLVAEGYRTPVEETLPNTISTLIEYRSLEKGSQGHARGPLEQMAGSLRARGGRRGDRHAGQSSRWWNMVSAVRVSPLDRDEPALQAFRNHAAGHLAMRRRCIGSGGRWSCSWPVSRGTPFISFAASAKPKPALMPKGSRNSTPEASAYCPASCPGEKCG